MKIEEFKTTYTTLLRFQAEYGGSPGSGNRSGENEISHDTFFNMNHASAWKSPKKQRPT